MTADELRALQAPLKEQYRNDPASASKTLRAEGVLDVENVACRVDSFLGPVSAGLHPAAGGDARWACSGDMLLQALAACAGVTLGAVATALGIAIRGGTVRAEGDLDFRGTLGVSKEVPVGFTAIRLAFEIDTDATPEQLDKLVGLAERYCVIFQTLRHPSELTVTRRPETLNP